MSTTATAPTTGEQQTTTQPTNTQGQQQTTTEPPKPAPPTGQQAATPPAGQQTQTETPEQVIARLQSDVERLNREKEAVRIQKEGELKQEAQRKQLLAMAEVVGLEIEDPSKETLQSLQEKLTGKVLQGDQQSQQINDDLKSTKIELAVFKAAGPLNVDADKLTNRVSFVKAMSTLDPSAADFDAKVKSAIEAEIQNDPTLKTGGAGAGASGAHQYGGAGGGEITQEAFNKMGIAERTKLMQSNPALYERLANG